MFQDATAKGLDQPADAARLGVDDEDAGSLATQAFRPFGERGRRRDGGGHPLAVEAERRFRDPRLPGLGDDQPGRDSGDFTAASDSRRAAGSFRGTTAQDGDEPAKAVRLGVDDDDPAPPTAPALAPLRGRVIDRTGRGHSAPVETERRLRDPSLPGLGDDQPGWDFAGVTAGPVGSRRDDAATRRVGRDARVRDGRSGYGNPHGAGVPAIRGEWPTTRWRRPSPRGRGGASLPGSAAPRTRRRPARLGLRRGDSRAGRFTTRRRSDSTGRQRRSRSGWAIRVREPARRRRSCHSGRVADDEWRRPSPRGRGGAPLPGSAAPRTRRRRGRDSSGCHGAAGRFAGAAGPVRGASGQCTAVAPAARGEWSGWPIERRPVGRTLGYPRSINALGRPPPPCESDDPSPTRSRPGAPAPDRLRVRRTPLSRVGRPRGGPSPRHSGEAGNHPR